jgi:YggT family protein
MAEAAVRSGGQHRQVHSETHVPIETVLARIVYWVFGAIEILLLFRFVLRLFGANPHAPFTEFVYRLSGYFMAPFLAVFPTVRLEQAVFEWSALLAAFVYALIGWGIVSLIYAVVPREGVTTVEESEHVDDSHRGT